MSSYINSIGIANPFFKHEQNDILSFMLKDAVAIEHQKKLKAAFRVSGVDTRYSILPDFGTSLALNSFLSTKPIVDERMKKYREEAIQLALKSIHACFEQSPSIQPKDITHLINVSCTGMYAPGIDIDIINALPLSKNTARASLNFMGCNAAINALRMADAIVKADSNAKVLVVCVELCTLHYQASTSNDFILSNTLFSDGAAAVIVSSTEENSLFEIDSFYSSVYSEGSNDMCWNITSKGFEMILSSYIPDLISTGISNLIDNRSLKLNEANHLAIHPGGRKIVDSVRSVLNLTEDQVSDSYNTLKNYGNMSSPTILFVLHAMSKNKNIKKSDTINALSFGPGLTIEVMKVFRALDAKVCFSVELL